jgi:hypothetical protein
MKRSEPPALATWLLEHLSSGPRTKSLLGDLIEEYGHGRSRIWYWRQVLVAIVVSFCKEIRAHSLLALRAVAIGWAVWFIYEHFLAGWMIGLLSPLEYRIPFAFAPVGGLLWWMIWLSVRTFSGWLVGRLHGPHRTTMVLVFAISVLLSKGRILPFTFRLVGEVFDNPRYLSAIIGDLAGVILPPICVLIGGLSWTSKPYRHVALSPEPDSE